MLLLGILTYKRANCSFRNIRWALPKLYILLVSKINELYFYMHTILCCIAYSEFSKNIWHYDNININSVVISFFEKNNDQDTSLKLDIYFFHIWYSHVIKYHQLCLCLNSIVFTGGLQNPWEDKVPDARFGPAQNKWLTRY